MANLINIDKLPANVQRDFGSFAEKILALFPDRVLAVAITGEATGSDYDPKTSEITSVFIFDEIDFQVFHKTLKMVDEASRKGITAPLFLSQQYLLSSLDVFPVEFLDIKENHVLIYGQDMFSSLDIHTEHLRLFCEQQVKGRLIRIRQAYLEVGLRPEAVSAMLKDSLSSLIPIFRNLIRLKGQAPRVDKKQIIDQLANHYDIDATVLLRINEGNKQDIADACDKYMTELQKLARQVDQL